MWHSVDPEELTKTACDTRCEIKGVDGKDQNKIVLKEWNEEG